MSRDFKLLYELVLFNDDIRVKLNEDEVDQEEIVDYWLKRGRYEPLRVFDEKPSEIAAKIERALEILRKYNTPEYAYLMSFESPFSPFERSQQLKFTSKDLQLEMREAFMRRLSVSTNRAREIARAIEMVVKNTPIL